MFKRELVNFFVENGFERDEAESEVSFLIEISTGMSQKELVFVKEIEPKMMNLLWDRAKERIATGKPLQYVVGEAFFMNKKYLVDENTLIPRPETEILVAECSKLIKENGYKKVLDIGTGSGVIACELALVGAVEVVASDISAKALEKAKLNASRHGPLNIKFVESNLFSEITEKFDLIVSNPPYIPLEQKNSLQSEVGLFEPHTALFAGGKEGTDFYKRIVADSKEFLNNNAHIAFEIGIGQACLVSEFLAQEGFANINIIKDFDGIDRVITAKFAKI